MTMRIAVGVIASCLFLASCWIAERPTDPEYRARAYIPESEWDNFIEALRHIDNLDRIVVSDQIGILGAAFEGQRDIAATLQFSGNIIIYATKSFSFDTFLISTNYNSLRNQPTEEYLCSIVYNIESIVISLDGNFRYIEGPCSAPMLPLNPE
ncbi:hypothetical protein [Glycocaulis sp.]|uniref:hypothetical protein n=1 Tax=Glycocaulis sp. TaxID=1969725 RepID=UPI003D200BFF